MRFGIILAIAVALSGCLTQKQRHYVTLTEPDTGVVLRSYCTQRNTLVAIFGENAELHKMAGMCGTFEGDASNVGFNEEGRKALADAVKAGICGATGGAGCVVGALLGGDDEETGDTEASAP